MRRTTLTLAMVVAMATAHPVAAHTSDEQDEWYRAWSERVSEAGLLTPDLLTEWKEFTERHAEPAPYHGGVTDAPKAPRPAVGGSYVGASGEPWRSLVATHFPASAVDTMTCLVGYESAGNPSARNPSSGASGLLQVMPFWADHFGVSRSSLFDPDTNVRIARKVWDAQGFGAWSPYRRGLCR